MTKNVLTLRTNQPRYFSLLLFLVLLIACSTKKDKLINRQFQALNTKYNVLYNGNIALDKGVEELKLKYKDNFWEILPIERMQVSKENVLPGEAKKDPNFDRAEEKATKAIQKRSMNIDGKEKNPQMDEAHLLLGKSRYYDQRFVPALEAFNYILYKYPESDKIYEAKIWREKTNMRMDNDALAVKNLRALLTEIKFKDQIFADANATLAQAFLNIEQKDSAMYRLRLAEKFTKSDEEKARYRFILGQIFEELGQKDSAFVSFQSVIDMRRKSPRRYIIQAHAEQAKQFDLEKGDTLAFIEKYKDLLKDRENRPFLDVLNHQVALFYDRQKNSAQAIKFYNKSLRTKSEDQYLMASNYRNVAKIYFDNAKYQTAGHYYDSTLVRLDSKTREYKYIKKKRDNLADVIKYEDIAQKNDSILNVVSLSDSDKKSFYEDYIAKLKKADIAKAALEKAKQEKQARLAANISGNDDITDGNRINLRNAGKDVNSIAPSSQAFGPKPTAKGSDSFYFYNPSTVAYGKLEFRKKWGERTLRDNWRLSSAAKEIATENTAAKTDKDSTDKEAEKAIEEKYTADFYLKQLPTSQQVLDSLAKERNFAYYQLGVIYKEKFKEYKLATNKLELLLNNKPEERLVLPAMYNLYKIYEITDTDKATAMKNAIIAQYPESRYAQILGNSHSDEELTSQSPEVVYQNLFKQYEDQEYIKVLGNLENAVNQFTGEEIIPKMELLKANTLGKLKGLKEYKSALNYVALNYPNSEEGKQAEQILSKDVPKLEKLKFYHDKPESWKIIYKIGSIENPETKVLIQKIKKFTSERTSEKLKYSIDIYTMEENFIVIHGMASEENAKGIVSILTDYKDYLIKQTAIVISNENYKIVQIKKNLDEYLVTPPTAPVPEAPEPLPAEKPAKERAGKEIRGSKTTPARNPRMQPPPGKDISPEDTDDPEPETIQKNPPKREKMPSKKP